MVRSAFSLAPALLLGAVLMAQQPTFEVASVKRAVSGRMSAYPFPTVLPGGRFTATQSTVEAVLMFAYDVKPYQIISEADWVREQRFETNAKARGEAPAVDDVRLMVRSLLEDRFGLLAHFEQRTADGLALVRARPDGSLGPKLIEIDDCDSKVVNELRRKSPEKYPPPGDGWSACSAPGLDTLALALTYFEGVPVIDATGLKGSYYYSLVSRISLAGAFYRVPVREDLPSLPVALDEQLGLKLEPRRVTYAALVVDSVQEPTEN
jgi:uncharacterized protein (TIGR03435 family)